MGSILCYNAFERGCLLPTSRDETEENPDEHVWLFKTTLRNAIHRASCGDLLGSGGPGSGALGVRVADAVRIVPGDRHQRVRLDQCGEHRRDVQYERYDHWHPG